MLSKEEKLKQFERITHQIVDDWYERVKQNYVTEEDSHDPGDRTGTQVLSRNRQSPHQVCPRRGTRCHLRAGGQAQR